MSQQYQPPPLPEVRASWNPAIAAPGSPARAPGDRSRRRLSTATLRPSQTRQGNPRAELGRTPAEQPRTPELGGRTTPFLLHAEQTQRSAAFWWPPPDRPWTLRRPARRHIRVPPAPIWPWSVPPALRRANFSPARSPPILYDPLDVQLHLCFSLREPKRDPEAYFWMLLCH